MKKFYTFVSALLLSASLWAQAPQKMSYQAVIRGENSALVVEKTVGVKISVLQGSDSGSAVYTETHTSTTNSNGLVSLSIGAGKNGTGDFSKIDWSKGPYFVKIETDLAGGTNYQLTSVSELMSVPFALYAANSQPGPKGEAGAQGPAGKDGAQGPKGDKGEPGIQGAAGKDGINGADGKDGAQGPKGETGVQGPAGKDGVNGKDGKVEFQNLKVSLSGDSLYLTNGNFVIIPGISAAQPKPTSGYGQNISDNDGNTYKTVYIGKQQWMAENLKTAKYNDGTAIPYVTDNTQWQNNTTGAWSYYNNDVANNAKYGKLYNWYAVSSTTNGNKNVCPTGWHVPTDAEWTVLTDYLGGTSVAGGKMKEVGTTSWKSPNTDATNTSLFTGLPGGLRNPDGNYYGTIGSSGYWWSSSENSSGNAWSRNLSSLNSNASRIYLGDNGSKFYGMSIRCIKD